MLTTRHVKTTLGKARGRDCNPQLLMVSRGGEGGDGCDFTLIVFVCACVHVCVCLRMRVHSHWIGGVSGISKSSADFTGTAGIMCWCVLLRQHECMFMCVSACLLGEILLYLHVLVCVYIYIYMLNACVGVGGL